MEPSSPIVPTLRPASPLEEPSIVTLLDDAFGRTECDSRLALELAGGHPAFERRLALLAEVEGEAAGWALLLPRRFRMRGLWVSMGVLGPIGVAPARQGLGVGGALVRACLDAMEPNGLLAVVLLGSPLRYGRHGFAPAFDLHTLRVPTHVLPEEGDTSDWRALRGEDLEPLEDVHLASYGAINGCEERLPCALDWECLAPDAHTLVRGAVGAPSAYLRFRKRAEFEVTECGAADADAVQAVVRLLSRLAREHARREIRLNLALPHPVARCLLELGGLLERSDFGGAAMMCVRDWGALLRALAPSWAPALRGLRKPSCSLEIEGRTLRLAAGRHGATVGEGRPRRRHVWIPPGWGPGLITGQRAAEELVFDRRVRARSRLDPDFVATLRLLFPGGTAQWVWSPAYEIADED